MDGRYALTDLVQDVKTLQTHSYICRRRTEEWLLQLYTNTRLLFYKVSTTVRSREALNRWIFEWSLVHYLSTYIGVAWYKLI